MIITAIKTGRVVPAERSIFQILDNELSSLPEKSILAITSKVVSLCENRVVPMDTISLENLIKQEADYYLPRHDNKYKQSFTITNHTLMLRAGIDISPKSGYYILWPKDPQKTAEDVMVHLKNKFGLRQLGVVITDSVSTPFRLGVTGIAIGFSGFKPLKDYNASRANIAGGLAAAAVLAMGEGKEQTPLALIKDVDFVDFCEGEPASEDLESFNLTMDSDLFAPVLENADWQKGSGKP